VSWIESYSEYAEEVRAWWDRVNPAWPRVRRAALDLLKREQRLAEIVRLIGPDALPDDQRLTLLTADLIKNGFLQQNSFDEVDMYCVPAKQVRILELLMEFHVRALSCIKLGATLIKINALPVRERLARLKSEIKNDDDGAMVNFEHEMKAAFDELERSYRGRETQ
jgi:V/A-type H+-transporting ATPase subunit A